MTKREIEGLRKLRETWREHFQGQGYSKEQSERMADTALGAGAVAQLREADGGGAPDLATSFTDHFESQGMGATEAKAAGMIAAGDLNPSPRMGGGDIVALVES